MDIKRITIISGTALFAFTATASAGPMSVSSSTVIAPPTQIEQAHYFYRHHYRHYGWRHGWRHYGWRHHGWRHYGWRRGLASPYYAYGYPYTYGYGAGLAGLATAPLMTGRSVAVSPTADSGNYCATPVKTCLLYEPGWLGTGCSCKVYGGYARGIVE